MDVRLDGTPGGPCAGMKVLDFSTVVSGPLCSMILGDLGADVIKVEALRGDATRMMGPPFRPGGLTPIFAQFNRNKRSVALDLKREEGRAVAQRLARDADVVVQNFRPGVVERLGIDYASLSRDNPGLVYVSVNGFGPDGPYADQPAYDSVIQGYTGHMPIQGGRSAAPMLVRSLAADKASGLTASYGALAALLARERNGGRGQTVDVPMLDAYAAYMLPDALLDQTFLPADTFGLDFSMVHRTWATTDGHVVIMLVEDAQFQALCRVLERDDLATDPRYANFIGRIMNYQELTPVIEGELCKRSTAELVERAHQFRAPLAPVNSVQEFLADPQVAWNRTVFEADHASGPLRYLRNPVRLPETPPALYRHPPTLGEHTDEVLRAAGYGDEEIATMRSSAVVG